MPQYGNTNVHPDASIVAVFKQMAFKNDAKSVKEGREIFEDWEVCELRYPGSSNVGVYPANAMSHWQADPMTGTQVQITYAERFRHQYDQFKAHAQQTKEGTPLDLVPFLTAARRAELRSLWQEGGRVPRSARYLGVASPRPAEALPSTSGSADPLPRTPSSP